MSSSLEIILYNKGLHTSCIKLRHVLVLVWYYNYLLLTRLSFKILEKFDTCTMFIGRFALIYHFNIKQFLLKRLNRSGSIFFVETRVTPEKVYELSNFQKFAIKIRFLKILRIHGIFFYNSRIFCCYFFKKETPHVIC